MKIALVQFGSCVGMPEVNLELAIQQCEAAANTSCDLVMFPEIWHNGYPKGDRESNDYSWWLQTAIEAGSPPLLQIEMTAAKLGIAIGYSYLEKRGEDFLNSFMLSDMSGKTILRQSKIHTCAWGGAESYLTPGDELGVAQLNTRSEQITVGVMICMDREYPETARVLGRKGAELMLVPNACELISDDIGDLRIAQLRGRAWENFVAIAMVNYPEPVNDGHSMVVLPNGQIVNQVTRCEELQIVELDIGFVRSYRSSELQMREDRRQPRLYKMITEDCKNMKS